MFGDGKIKVIQDDDNELYINMWQMTGHLINSADILREQVGGDNSVTATLDLLATTIMELALYEYGLRDIDAIDNVDDAMVIWQLHKDRNKED